MEEQGKEPELQYLESLVGNLTGWDDAETRIRQAYRLDEFVLFGQRIVPLDPKAGVSPRLEMLVRMREEEETLTPPGAFFPFLEYYGMMPALDRWVVQHAIQCRKSKGRGMAPALNINLSPVTFAKVKSIQGVCAAGGIQTVAEFVEQPETIDKLKQIGVNYVQGYGVARPEALN